MKQRWKVAAVLLAASTDIAVVGATSAQTNAVDPDVAIVGAITQADQCTHGEPAIQPVMSRHDFSALPEGLRGYIFYIAAFCAVHAKNYDAAYDLSVRGTKASGDEPNAWRQRLGIAGESKRNEDVVVTLEEMATQAPTALNQLPFRWLGYLYGELRDEAPLRRRMLVVLTAPGFEPVEPLAFGDHYKSQLAGILVDEGKTKEATTLVSRITVPTMLVSTSLDPRLRPLLPAGFNARAATERFLATLRDLSASHTGSLAVVLEVATTLRQLGRPEEALATLQAVDPEGPRAAKFNDLDDQRIWWWDGLARTHQLLGRYDDAVTAFRHAAQQQEDGGKNVSQTINLGHAQIRFGRPGDALKTIAAFEMGGYNASPYGLMELALVRGCARSMLTDSAVASDIAFAAEHEKDHPSALFSLYLCVGDLDGAAKVLIHDLDDRERRADKLLLLSDFDPYPASLPLAPYETKLPELKARPDVRAAIARSGGTRRINLLSYEL
jgi:tetratricopeptide (TPR) repeat protein